MADILNRVNDSFRQALERLESEGHSAAQMAEELNQSFADRGAMLIGGKLFPVYLKPVFMTPEQERIVRDATVRMMSVLEKITDLYYSQPELRDVFRLKPAEIELAEIETHLERKVWITRNDAFLDGHDFKFIEFNCDSPGGPMYSDIQIELLESTPIMDALRQQFRFADSYRFVPQVLDTLMTAYAEFCHKRGIPPKDKPFIGMVAGDGSSTLPEFKLIAAWLRERGFGSRFSDPRWLTWDGRHVRNQEGEAIDIIYRRGWLPDWTDHMDEIRPLIQGYRAGAVCVVNPPRSILAANKHLVGLVQEERFQSLFTADEQAAIREHLPWTRFVEPGRTTGFDGQPVDLVPYLRQQRPHLVLKPMDMLGGKDVCIGPDASESEWDEWLEKAHQHPFVAQQFVPIPEEKFPVARPELEWVDRKVNHNFYAFMGGYSGGMVRASASSVINISKDGGLAAILVAEGER